MANAASCEVMLDSERFENANVEYDNPYLNEYNQAGVIQVGWTNVPKWKQGFDSS